MRFIALVTDYDGTIATDGAVLETTVKAFERLVASGRKLVMVTGRELPDLIKVCPYLDMFERVVVENGAVLYTPATKETRLLCEPPTPAFAEALRARGIPISTGHVIVATWEPHEKEVLEVVRNLGLELQVIFNKGAVMVLPSGVNKQTGMTAALRELGLSAHNTVGVGDAENDHAFLAASECAAAVANALPMLKERADVVLSEARGAGVVELIDRILGDDLRDLEPRLSRHHVVVGRRSPSAGTDEAGEEVRLPPSGINVLVAGPSGSGKSTATVGIWERLVERGYQCCLMDPEGDHETFAGAVSLGTPQKVPEIDEIVKLLEHPEQHAVVNLLGVPLDDRPRFFAGLLPRLQEMRVQRGRPHWIIVDEAHHLVPAEWDPARMTMPEEPDGLFLVTMKPEHVSHALLHKINVLIAVGDRPDATYASFCSAVGQELPADLPRTLERGEILLWVRDTNAPPMRIRVERPKNVHQRHRRKYAEGDLGPDEAFYFRGPDEKLKLRAQNLVLFVQIGEGVDDETWMHHLRQHDFSTWFRTCIKDEDLAAEAEQVERRKSVSPQESRKLIREAIEEKYTAPA